MIRLKTSAAKFVLVAALFALAACAAKPARDSDSHYDIAITVPATSFGSDSSIMLRRVDIRGIQSGRPLIQIIASNPVEFQEERGHYWHVSAPTLLERAITDSLGAASTDAVFGTSANMQDADYQYSVDMRLFAYEPGGNAQVAFNVVVKDDKGRIVLSQDYATTSPLASPAPAAAVNALGAAFSAALSEMAADLAATI